MLIKLWKGFLFLVLIGAVYGLTGCASAERTLKSVKYACVDIEYAARTSNSGVLGRGLVLPEGETLTAETVQMLCEY